MASVSPQRSLALAAPDQHGDGLHPMPRHGTVLVWNQRSQGQQWRKVKPTDDLGGVLIQHAGQKDRFLSVNQFDGWRLLRLLRSLRAVYIDIDQHYSVAGILMIVEDAGLPAPNYVVMSGRGVHLYWLLDAVPPGALPVWQAVQKKIISLLHEYGADRACSDCTRVLRLVGSINGKNGELVEGYIVTPGRWTLRDLSNEVLGFRERRPKNRKRVTALETKRAETNVRRASGEFQLWHSRYRDLCLIADHHAFMSPAGGGLEDFRDRMLFLMSNALSWFVPADRVLDEIRRVAQTYMPTYTLAEAEKVTRPIVRRALGAENGQFMEFRGKKYDPRYHFKSETIRDWLGDLLTDELEPQLKVLCSPERLAERDKIRRKAKDRARYQTHYDKKISANKPWESEGVSRATWYRRQARIKSETKSPSE